MFDSFFLLVTSDDYNLRLKVGSYIGTTVDLSACGDPPMPYD